MLKIFHHGPVTELRMATTVGGKPLYICRAWLVDGLLIDTGPPNIAREFELALPSLKITQALNTHSHEDHVGNNHILNRHGIIPMAPLDAIPIIESPQKRIPLYRRLAWGQPLPAKATPLPRQIATDHYRFEVIPTPGHSDDHISIWEPNQGWFFAGDLYIAAQRRLFLPWEQYDILLASLGKALQLNFEGLYCAHSGLLPHGHRAIERKIQFMQEIREESLALQADGWSTEHIARRLFGSEDPLYWFSLGEMSNRRFIKAALNSH